MTLHLTLDMRIHLQTPTLHCRDALSVRNFSNFQAAFDPTNWDHQLIARNPPEPHWRQMNHEPWNPMAAMCIWKNAILQLHSRFTEIPEKWLGIVILCHTWTSWTPPHESGNNIWKNAPWMGGQHPHAARHASGWFMENTWHPWPGKRPPKEKLVPSDEWIGFVCFFFQKIRK